MKMKVSRLAADVADAVRHHHVRLSSKGEV